MKTETAIPEPVIDLLYAKLGARLRNDYGVSQAHVAIGHDLGPIIVAEVSDEKSLVALRRWSSPKLVTTGTELEHESPFRASRELMGIPSGGDASYIGWDWMRGVVEDHDGFQYHAAQLPNWERLQIVIVSIDWREELSLLDDLQQTRIGQAAKHRVFPAGFWQIMDFVTKSTT